jgi:hypothetical protein
VNPCRTREALEQVGSYCRQIGHLAEALEVVIQRLKLLESADLSRSDRDALHVFPRRRGGDAKDQVAPTVAEPAPRRPAYPAAVH